MICAGIDAGSRAVKIVLLDADSQEVIASEACDQGVEQETIVERLLDEMLAKQGLKREDISRTVATGYARNIISAADTTITEITCHARGVHARAPEARTVIEIGGQDSKVLRLNADGAVRDFAMNDRCAAGTGRFLEIVADRLDVDLSDLGSLAAQSANPASISSMCVVFAETEIIGLLSAQVSREDIIAGVQLSIASRVAAMAGRNVEDPVVFTGGVARIPGMVAALASVLERPVAAVADPQSSGAHGAALLACRQSPAALAKGL